jgi:hypothetical protein
MEIEGELIDINTPPKDTCGYFGLVLKPKYMPLWLAKILKHQLEIRKGWLNMPKSILKPKKGWDERWWFDHSRGREKSKQCKPIFWCKIRSYYNVKVIPNVGHPFTWKTEDPKGEYNVAE